MRLLFKSLLGLLILFQSLSVASWADESKQARAEIQAAYDASNRAAGRLDVDGTMATCSSDFVAINQAGKKTTALERHRALEGLFHQARAIKIEAKIVSISLRGKVAEVRVREHLQADIKDPRSGRVCSTVIDDTSQDRWLKTAKGWRLTRSTVLDESAVVDGAKIK